MEIRETVMGAFIVAGLIMVGTVLLSLFVGFAESMATAPRYDNSPLVVFAVGTALSVLVAATHWLPHIGW
jgi:hypothetical protein